MDGEGNDEPCLKKRRYTRRGKMWHEGRSYNYNSHSGRSSHYRCAVLGCLGRANKSHATGEVTVTQEHICGASVSSRELEQAQLEEAAYIRLRELTAEAGEGARAIDIVRKLFDELPPERRAALPSKDKLKRRVRVWARRDGVQLVKATFEDLLGEEDLEGEGEVNANPPLEPPSPSLDDSHAHVAKKEPINDQDDDDGDDDPCGASGEEMETNPRGKKTKVVFLREKCSRGKPKVRIDEQVYVWTMDLKMGASSYKCQEARIGCRVTAKIFRAGEGNRKPYYEIRGTHVHKQRTIPPRHKKGRGSEPHLKLVDEEGRDLGAVPLGYILTAGEESTRLSLDYDKLRRVNSGPEASNNRDSEGPTGNTDDDSNDLGDTEEHGDGADDNDFPMDFDDNEPDSEENVRVGDIRAASATSSASMPILAKVEGNRKQIRIIKGKKSGEKCFVCGDDLMLSETISSNLETFRKACCYLNVKTDRDWFQASNAKMGYFCESCTTEITRIQQLYKKVEEIQSLIFKRVEQVEKRIADAVIIDCFIDEGPPIRLEGFRKQVLMNYRNKLKLRREIRVGRKMGHSFSEVHPHASANMFACDPTETDAFRKAFSTERSTTSVNSLPVKRGRGLPKSKNETESIKVKSHAASQDISLDEDFESAGQDISEDVEGGDGDSLEFEVDDAVSVSSEREAKFWEGNPGQLQIDSYNCDPNDVDNNDNYDESIVRREQNSENTDESDLDFDGNQDDSDEDWEMSGTRRRKMRSTAKRRGRPSKKPVTPKSSATCSTSQSSYTPGSKSGKTISAPETSKQKRKSGSGSVEFPDVVLTKDGRMFMAGIEIIKNAPGAYKRLPKSVSFSCGVCSKMIQRFWSIRNHICGHHLGMFKCTTCEKQFTDLRTLDAHVEFTHSGKNLAPIPCPICEKPIPLGRNLDGVANMQHHRWSHLSEEEKMDPQYKSFCPPHKRDPNRLKKTDGLSTYMCSYCSKTFRQTLALRNHELSHAPDGPQYQCQYCGKIYSTKRNYGGHIRRCSQKFQETTESLVRYACPKCPVRFKTRGVRNKHVRWFLLALFLSKVPTKL